jgi:hypothetical protein
VEKKENEKSEEKEKERSGAGNAVNGKENKDAKRIHFY